MTTFLLQPLNCCFVVYVKVWVRRSTRRCAERTAWWARCWVPSGRCQRSSLSWRSLTSCSGDCWACARKETRRQLRWAAMMMMLNRWTHLSLSCVSVYVKLYGVTFWKVWSKTFFQHFFFLFMLRLLQVLGCPCLQPDPHSFFVSCIN